MKLKFPNPLRNWDDTQKAAAVKISGCVIALIAAFILLATLSYLFHWKEDMSLFTSPDMMDAGKKVANFAGKLGAKTGYFLVGRCFGLGSFALLVILAAISVRLIVHKWLGSLMKTTLLALSGAFIASIAFAFIGSACGLGGVFGGGLGGECGAAVSASMVNLLGPVITAAAIVLLAVCWLFCTSRGFNNWVAGLGSGSSEDTGKDEFVSEHEDEVKPGFGFGRRKAKDEEKKQEDVEEAEPETVQEPEPTHAAVKPTPAPKPAPVVKPQADGAAETPEEGGLEIIQGEGLSTDIQEELKPIDNRLDPPDGLPKYKFPTLDLLENYESARHDVSSEELMRNNNKIRATLANYKIQINDVKAIMGPTVTLYKVYPAPGVQIAQIKRLQEDIAVSLGAKGVRVVTLNDSVGIEVANDKASIVPLKALLNDDAFRNAKAELPVAIGYTITQKVKVFDLADAPHLLIAGATKQGKSVGLNVIVGSLLYARHPSELRFVFIDPKMVEFSSYAQLLHHYLAVLPDAADDEEEKANAIVKKPKDAEKILRSLCTEMDDRYELLAKAGVNNIKLYNAKYKDRKLNPKNGHKFLPYIVTVVDEYADLTMTTGASPDARAASRSITNSIIRLAQKGRAAGLHVILATQRPSVDVISGIIKSNFPMRIAFRVASRIDSQTILDAPGAEKLIGKGDMLFSAGIESERIQCGYVSGEEVDAITSFIGEQQGYAKSYQTPYYLPTAEEASEEGEGGGMTDMGNVDDRFEEAAKVVVTTQKASTSYLQTRLGLGFARAARVMSQLEAAGIVGPQEGAKPRAILVPDLNSLQPILDAFVK